MKELKLVIPGTPISVNHYKGTCKGRYFVKSEALRFKAAIGWMAKGVQLEGEARTRYGVEITIYLGKGQKGDIDNFPKCVLDGIKDARIVTSDAKFTRMQVELDRDRINPRTEIIIYTRSPK